MRQGGIVPGVLSLAAGIYFLLQQFNVPYHDVLLRWPTLFIVFGLAFLGKGANGKDRESLFSGALMLGLGLHFHATSLFEWWPSNWPIYVLLLGAAFLTTYLFAKKEGLIPGVVATVIGIVGLMAPSIMSGLGTALHMIGNVWPLLLLGLGFYFLFFKR